MVQIFLSAGSKAAVVMDADSNTTVFSWLDNTDGHHSESSNIGFGLTFRFFSNIRLAGLLRHLTRYLELACLVASKLVFIRIARLNL
jgi:hypothetical protein